MTNREKWEAWLNEQNEKDNQILRLNKLIKQLDKVISDQDKKIFDLEQACNDYNNLMKECILDEIR